VTYCTGALDAAQGADLLVVVTEWNEFRAIAPEKLREAMQGDLIVDLRNMYEPSAMREAGFRYQSIGRR
jgi:UDPglucose 6-dehydrogenase